jgi:hypothetical protein
LSLLPSRLGGFIVPAPCETQSGSDDLNAGWNVRIMHKPIKDLAVVGLLFLATISGANAQATLTSSK